MHHHGHAPIVYTPVVGMRQERPIPLSLLFSSMMLLCVRGMAFGATKPTLHASTITLAAIKEQSLAVAKGSDLSITQATVNNWMSTATAVFQIDNSTNGLIDVVCPVRLSTAGSLGAFSSDYDVVDSSVQAILDDRTSEWVQIVRTIIVCGDENFQFFVDPPHGCSGLGTHLRIIEDINNMNTLAHEAVHLFRGRGHVCDLDSGECDRNPDFKRYVMYPQDITAAAMDILEPADCIGLQSNISR